MTAGTRQAPWTARIFELLADGPQPLEYVIAETRFLVPPGRAHRQGEKKREEVRVRRIRTSTRKSPRVPVPTDDDTIRTGQRQIVMDTVSRMVRNGRLEYVEGDAGRYLQVGRERIPSGMANSPMLAKLQEHQPTFTKWRVPEIRGVTGRPIDAVDITCSCGWTWKGAMQDPDGDWHVRASSKDEAQKVAFTPHRRSFV